MVVLTPAWHLQALNHGLKGAAQGLPILAEKACHDLAVGTVYVTGSVHRHHCAHLDVPGLHRIGAEAGFHGAFNAHDLAHGAAGARAYIPLFGCVIGCVFAGLICHGSIGTHVIAPAAQIKHTALAHQRHPNGPHRKAFAALL